MRKKTVSDNGLFLFGDRIMDMKVAEAQAEVQGYRLQRLAHGVRARGARLCCAALSQLGRRLVTWGIRLQKRYGAEGSTPTPARVG